MTHDDGATTTAATYFDAWLARDFARLRAVLADDVDFAGPLGQVTGGDECLRGLGRTGHDHDRDRYPEGLQRRIRRPDVVRHGHHSGRPGAGGELDAGAGDGKITRIRVAFDPRGIAK